MSKQIITNYSFSTAAKTVTLTDLSAVDLKRLYLITDVTTNTILYNFADSSVATATVATNVITLSALPGGVSNGDALQIIYEVITTDTIYETPLLPNNAAKETGGNLAAIATNTGNGATSANQTNGSQQTKITDGTTVANVNAVSGKNGLYVTANSATGSAVPATSFFIGVSDGAGNLQGASSIQLVSNGNSGNKTLAVGPTIYNGTNQDKMSSASATKGTTGTGLLGAGILGFDGTNYQAIKTKTDGTLVPGTTSSSSVTSVASAANSTQLLAANSSRTGAYFYNDSNYPLYIAFATSASTSAYTVQVPSQGFYEMPTQPVYTGAIFGIWSTANGNARITELS